MYICYLDESGTPEAADASKHFVLVGLAVLASAWKNKDRQIDTIKSKYGLAHHEVHTAWMLRDYAEQKAIQNFNTLDYAARRALVIGVRAQRIAVASPKKRKALELEYRKTSAYIHLTREERRACIQELADLLGTWGDARIFADAQQKGKTGSEYVFYVDLKGAEAVKGGSGGSALRALPLNRAGPPAAPKQRGQSKYSFQTDICSGPFV